jgi:hypothetical protein
MNIKPGIGEGVVIINNINNINIDGYIADIKK